MVKMSRENLYIVWRKLKAAGNKLCFVACRIFPIRNNRISICTFEGKGGFGCNPKYIAEELHQRNPNYEFIWFVNDLSKEFPPYIKKVPNTLWSRAFWLSTSRIWIDNYRKPYGTCKRRKQYYVNTWHGTIGFKSIGLWRGRKFSKMAYLVSRNDSDMIDGVVIDSKWCAEMFPKGMVYSGDFLWDGAPRCDVLYGDRTLYKERFRKKHGLALDARIIMFAPTFREGSVNGRRVVFSELWTLDFMRMLKNLEQRFGRSWYLCVRVHPQLAARAEDCRDSQLEGKMIDVSREDDMYEILAGMDAFITDYSSAAMDASFAHMPVFIYADDIGQYVNDRGSMLWNMTTDSDAIIRNNRQMTPGMDVILPYPVAQNNEELERRILKFDMEDYLSKMKTFEEKVELTFDGKASLRIADRIEAYMRRQV